MRRVFAASIPLFVLILLIAPALLGLHARGVYEDILADLRDALPGGRILLQTYDPGWFSASASAELAFDPRFVSPVRVRLDSRIEHGPLAWPRLPPRLARAQTRVELVEPALGLAPLSIDTDLEVSGGAVARLRSPPQALDVVPGSPYRLRADGLSGILSVAPDPERLAVSLSLSRLDLVGADGVVLHLSGLDIRSSLTGWRAGLYTGASRLALERLRVDHGGRQDLDAPLLAVDGLSLSFAPMPRDDLLEVHLDVDVRGLASIAAGVGASRLGIGLQRLHPESLAELSRGLRTLSSGTLPQSTRGLAGLALVTETLPRLLSTQPGLVLDPLSMQTVDGPVEGRLVLRMGALAAARTGPLDWIGALEGEGELSAPSTQVEAWLTQVRGPADASVGSARTDQAGLPLLARWIREGWVDVEGGRLSVVFRLEDAHLIINERSLAIHR